MNLILLGVVAGVIGTLVMDMMNHLLSRVGILLKINVPMIGRMASGWARGRFCYRHPDELSAVTHERLLGWFVHYAISVLLALIYVLGWHYFSASPISSLGALLYGTATTAASQFLVFPSLGLGFCGRKSADGIKASLSSLANHLFFGVGMALGIAIG